MKTGKDKLKPHVELIRNFYQYCKEKLPLDADPEIVFLDNAENSRNPLGKTGSYQPDKKNKHLQFIILSPTNALIVDCDTLQLELPSL